MAAEQLTRDAIDVLHTIGGDDTNTTAADLAAYLAAHDYDLTVVGLPKTVDNDVIPIRQSLGAWTAAEQGRPLCPQHRCGAHLEPADADHPRGDGPQLRLAHGSHRAALSGVAGGPGVRRLQPRPRELGRARGLCPRARLRRRRRGSAAQGGHGRGRRRQHLPVRRCGRRDDRRRAGGRAARSRRATRSAT